MREIHEADAITWLRERGELTGASVITSLPDYSEFPELSLEEWKAWFMNAAGLIFARVPADGVAIFYQRDSKREGEWVDKSYLVQCAAEAAGVALLWRKVVCRVPPGNVAFGRPGYSHLLCFASSLRIPPSLSTADVMPRPGDTTWTRGMGTKACEVACRFVLEQTPTRTIVDPFCGHGTVLAVAESFGLRAVGVERSRKRAEKARALRFREGKLLQPRAGVEAALAP